MFELLIEFPFLMHILLQNVGRDLLEEQPFL
jgi:hypothetical protein